MESWSKEQFESQLRIFNEGQIGVEYQGKLVASSGSVILDFELYKDWHDFDEISDNGYIRNHRPDGTTLYGIEIMVDPAFRGLKLARRLYDARKKLARNAISCASSSAGRIPGYAKHADKMSAREYIEKVMNKELQDPVLTTQVSNGFVLKRLIPGYLTADADSKGFAAFLEWTNLDYVPDPQQRFVPIAPVRVCVVQYQMRLCSDFHAFAGQCEYFSTSHPSTSATSLSSRRSSPPSYYLWCTPRTRRRRCASFRNSPPLIWSSSAGSPSNTT